jgi:hypothetical protein
MTTAASDDVRCSERELLADLTILFDGLRDRAKELRRSTATGELASLMVFGVGAVRIDDVRANSRHTGVTPALGLSRARDVSANDWWNYLLRY